MTLAQGRTSRSPAHLHRSAPTAPTTAPPRPWEPPRYLPAAGPKRPQSFPQPASQSELIGQLLRTGACLEGLGGVGDFISKATVLICSSCRMGQLVHSSSPSSTSSFKDGASRRMRGGRIDFKGTEKMKSFWHPPPRCVAQRRRRVLGAIEQPLPLYRRIRSRGH